MDGLTAIAAVFRATAGLDAKQAASLNPVRVKVLPMHGLRLKQQIIEWCVIKPSGLIAGPKRIFGFRTM